MKELEINIVPRTLHFKRPAGTSRGTLLQRKVWYILLRSPFDPSLFGVGECAPLPGLSPELTPSFEEELRGAVEHLKQAMQQDSVCLPKVTSYSSILFAFEMAFQQIQRQGSWHDLTPFGKGKQGIPINGLIWMGDYSFMYKQLEEKLKAGFRCIKIKIGNIDFEQ